MTFSCYWSSLAPAYLYLALIYRQVLHELGVPPKKDSERDTKRLQMVYAVRIWHGSLGNRKHPLFTWIAHPFDC
jgi:hypothetical protein